MAEILVHDKMFVSYITAAEISRRVKEMATAIMEDMSGRNPLFLSVLNGSFIFAADLLRAMPIPLEVSFVKLASYCGTGSTGAVRRLIGLDETLIGRTVVIVEDIVDTGITMDNLIGDLSKLHPEEIRIATLLFKEEAFIRDFPIDYCGFTISNQFVVGYGLDYNGHGRNYSDIYTLKT
jgi:hypoxanthine phosphoribosyltransferase